MYDIPGMFFAKSVMHFPPDASQLKSFSPSESFFDDLSSIHAHCQMVRDLAGRPLRISFSILATGIDRIWKDSEVLQSASRSTEWAYVQVDESNQSHNPLQPAYFYSREKSQSTAVLVHLQHYKTAALKKHHFEILHVFARVKVGHPVYRYHTKLQGYKRKFHRMGALSVDESISIVFNKITSQVHSMIESTTLVLLWCAIRLPRADQALHSTGRS